jgi:tape measure domain-containing protein
MASNLKVVFEIVGKGLYVSDQIEAGIRRIGKEAKTTFGKLTDLKNILIGAAIGGLSKQFVDAAISFEGLQNKMSAALGPMGNAAETIQWLRDESKRTGQQFLVNADSFASFAASTLRSNLTLEQTKKIYTDIAETSTSLHLSQEKSKLVFLALEQIASKGVVSMEELRRQLGESLPGAVQIGARAMGMTSGAFMKAVASGKIMSDEFLPKFAEQVRKELGGSFADASNSINANINRMQNSWFNIKLAIGNALKPILQEYFPQFITNMDSLASSIEKNSKGIQIAILGTATTIQILFNGLQMLADLLVTGMLSSFEIFGMGIDTLKTSLKSLTTYADGAFEAVYGALHLDGNMIKDGISKMGEYKDNFKELWTSIKVRADDIKSYWGTLGKESNKNVQDIADAMTRLQNLINKENVKPKPKDLLPDDNNNNNDNGDPVDDRILKARERFHEQLLKMQIDNYEKNGKVAYDLRKQQYEYELQQLKNQINEKIITQEDGDAMMRALHDKYLDDIHNAEDKSDKKQEDIDKKKVEDTKKLSDSIYDANYRLQTSLNNLAMMALTKNKKWASEHRALLYSMALADAAGAAVKGIYQVWSDKETGNTYTKLALSAAVMAEIIASTATQISQIKSSFARGTTSAPGGYSLVGEQGPEIANIPRGSQVFTAGQTQRIMQSVNNNSSSSQNIFHKNDSLTGEKLIKLLRAGKLRDFVTDFKYQMAMA